MTTANTLINGSLRLLGELAEGETPSPETSNDALVAMQQMLDSWSADRLAVFSTQDQTFTWPNGQKTRTLGPTGDFVGNRPVLVDDSTYFVVNNLTYNLSQVNEAQYNSIALKNSTSTYPLVMWINMDMPNITMKIYPVPTSDIEMHIISVTELSQPPTLATTLVIPPGYLRAFRFNLAVEIASEFGLAVPRQVARIAATSMRTIKRINNPNSLMSLPYALVSRGGSGFSIFSGLPM